MQLFRVNLASFLSSICIIASVAVSHSADDVPADPLAPPPRNQAEELPSVAAGRTPIAPAGTTAGPDDGWIYGSSEARDYVRRARLYDPQHALIEDSNRDRAVELYAAAIEAQPGAVSNAAIADRIAQLLAFQSNPKRGVTPRPELAAEWWMRCGEWTDQSQLLWAQSRMGLASVTVMRNTPQSGLKYLDDILALNPDDIDVESWKQASRVDDPVWKASERLRLQNELRALQQKVREKREYLSKAVQARETLALGPPPPAPASRWSHLVIWNVACLSLLSGGYYWRSRRRRNANTSKYQTEPSTRRFPDNPPQG